jgi:hypothetical protein
MTFSSFLSRRAVALSAPLLMATYGVLRFLDGLDGGHGPGLFWNLGHVALLLAVLGFGVLGVHLASSASRRHPTVAGVALVATLVGVALFSWVTLTDLSERLDDAWDMPDVLMAVGPLAFALGLVTLLALHVGRGVPAWSPAAFLLANVAIGVDLDLLLPAALVMLAAVYPLARRPLARGGIANVGGVS